MIEYYSSARKSKIFYHKVVFWVVSSVIFNILSSTITFTPPSARQNLLISKTLSFMEVLIFNIVGTTNPHQPHTLEKVKRKELNKIATNKCSSCYKKKITRYEGCEIAQKGANLVDIMRHTCPVTHNVLMTPRLCVFLSFFLSVCLFVFLLQ